tara:strand:+ start:4079 stop:4444 length:366 start_codon:yes stop_codon:yes gene_type:complete
MTRKTKGLHIRLTEQQRLAWHAAAGHWKLSRWIRALADEAVLAAANSDNVPTDRLAAFEDIRGDLADLRQQVQRLGNNVNQIAARVNGSDFVDSAEIDAAGDAVRRLVGDINSVLGTFRGR